MTFNHNVLQTVIAGIAAGIAIVAAVFSWKQVDISREHNRLSVKPILQITPYLEGKNGRNGLYLTNDGLGPALVKGFVVKSGGVVAEGFQSDRWSEILATTSANPACFGTAWPKGETAIKVGAELPLVFITKAEGLGLCQLELIKLVAGRPVEVTVEYESIYGESKKLVADSRIVSRTLDALYRQIAP